LTTASKQDGQDGRTANPFRLLIAAFGANTIAYLGWYTLPLQWAVLSGELGLDQGQTSLVVTAEVLTAAIVSIVMSFVVGARSPRITLGAGVLLALAGHVLALFANGFTGMLATRLIAGVGEGLLWLMLNATVARLDEPDRRFGQVNAVTAVLLAVVVVAAPTLAAQLPARSVYWILVGLTVLLMPSLLPFLLDRQFGAGVAIEKPSLRSVPAWALVAVAALWSMALTVTFSLSLPLGQRTGASEESIHAAIAMSMIGIVSGAGIAGMIGDRFGRVRTLAVIFGIELIASYLLVQWTTPVGFGLTLTVVNGCVYAALPYFLGLAARIDTSGGSAAAVAGAFTLGGGLSPTFGAYLIGLRPAYFAIFIAIAVFTIAAWLGAIFAGRAVTKGY
jgi:DHA1 family inner membrane transport protein